MPRLSLALASLSLSFLIAGCGSGGSTSNSPTNPTEPVLTVSPSTTTLAFASTTVGQTSAAQVFTFTNTGGATLTLGNFTASGATTSFGETTTCGASLAANSSCTLSFTFTPIAAGAVTETIVVTDNATSSSTTLTLTGTGVAVTVPSAALAPGLVFPTTTAATTSSSQDVALTNNGNAALTITSAVIGGANPSDFSISVTSCGSTLAAGATCTYSITFTPALASTNYAAALTVTDNSGNIAGSTQSVTLTGAGSAPVSAAQAVLTPTSLTFTPTNLNTAAGAQIITLSNPGTASLTGIALSIGGGTTSSAFTVSTITCGTTLAANGTCTLSVNFTPTAIGTYLAYLDVADSATGSPQIAVLNGTGQTAPAPIATFSPTSISFPTTLTGATTSSYSTTLTNTGTATLNITSIVLGGTNSTQFKESNTCGATLAMNANCVISATFTPSAATNYSATVTVTDNAAGSPTVINLTGAGTTSTVTRSFLVFGPAPPSGITGYVTDAPLITFINQAQKTLDMTMYELQDTPFTSALTTLCNNGVRVRVILSSSEKSNNAPAYSTLNGAGANCSAVYSNTAFTNTHQKTITIDSATSGAQTAILSLNLQTQYYSTSRDFALLENDTADIAAIEATFNADYAAGTPSGGSQGTSDFNYPAGYGDTGVVSIPTTGDLIWSPLNAQTEMLRIINNATSTLTLENEEMSAGNIVSALEAACKNGVTVHIVMVNSSTSSPYSSYSTEFKALEAAGCGVKTFADTSTGLYIHAKAVVADFGLSTQSVYMGSINYSTASMTENRELGIYIADPNIIQILNNTLTTDYANPLANPF
jgi:phosphatidylserine/phosphatidylglycerophosphate/cardiolipin synthase-like enzyme